MVRSVNGLEVDKWPPEVEAMWQQVRASEDAPEGEVSHANYFTPRPHRNEYDRGSSDEGFVYTMGRKVLIAWLKR